MRQRVKQQQTATDGGGDRREEGKKENNPETVETDGAGGVRISVKHWRQILGTVGVTV